MGDIKSAIERPSKSRSLRCLKENKTRLKTNYASLAMHFQALELETRHGTKDPIS